MTGHATFVYEGVFSPEGLMAGAGLKFAPAQSNEEHRSDEGHPYHE